MKELKPGTICYLKSDFREKVPLTVVSYDPEIDIAIVSFSFRLKGSERKRELKLKISLLVYGSEDKRRQQRTQTPHLRTPKNRLKIGDVVIINVNDRVQYGTVHNFDRKTVTVYKQCFRFISKKTHPIEQIALKKALKTKHLIYYL